MGIVVAAFMLVGLLMASPWVPPGTRRLRSSPNTVDLLASGAVMVAVAVLLLLEHGGDGWRRQPVMVRAHALLKPFAAPLVVALGLCFGLYAFALVRLNLGLPIPG